MLVDLKDRIAIVTGGGRDIGRAISVTLARCGASVVVNYNESRAEAEETVRLIQEAGVTAVAVAADVRTDAGVRFLADETRRHFGQTIHILVNNAGGIIGRRPITRVDADFIDRVMDVNVKSTILMTAAVLPYMPEGGAIVNMSSIAARHGGGEGSVVYGASKGAVLTMTRGMAREFAERKIRVNCVSPGLIATRFHDSFTSPESRATTVARTPLGREGTADDVAGAVAFLASDAAAFITGDSIEINGGLWFA
ncbi:MAG TPA: glucose 1-dehydrogenase [Rhodothermales bacterium]